MAKSNSYNYRTSRNTWKGKKTGNNPRRTSRNEGKPRIGQTHIAARNMPHAMFRHAWLPDGSQVAIARSNDRFICGHFDNNEKPLCGPVVFNGGNAVERALTWLDRQQNVDGA